MKKQKGKVNRRNACDSFLLKMDPKHYQRLPDNYFSVLDFPGEKIRAISIDLNDDGVQYSLHAVLPEGSRPMSAIIQATKDIYLYDVFGSELFPESFFIETTRKRHSGSGKAKYLSIVPGMSRRLTISPGHIFNTCDAVVSIDTNTKQETLGGDIVSVLGISTTRLSSLSFPKMVYITSQNAIEFRNLINPREKIGWAIALETMFDHEILKRDWKICVIVDAYMNELSNYNNGINLFTNTTISPYTLPSNVKLAYASSDTAQAHAINKCIHSADALSGIIYGEITKKDRFHTLPSNGDGLLYKALRLWSISDDGKEYTALIPQSA